MSGLKETPEIIQSISLPRSSIEFTFSQQMPVKLLKTFQGASTASLGNLFQCLPVLHRQTFFKQPKALFCY